VKHFIVKPNEHGWGIDTGWRFFPEDYINPTGSTEPFDLIWGNCKGVAMLRDLIAEMRQDGYEFELAPETVAMLEVK
jgi:hypothetical protein